MYVIKVPNVNYALYQGAQYLRQSGVQRDSRNGPVLCAPEPVTTCYENPTQRVLLHPNRDANPFFHLVEALWMIAGRNDLPPLTEFVKTMKQFSDDGKTLHGAYGHRWRNWFWQAGDAPSERDELPAPVVLDQLDWAVYRLKKDPNDRRVVIQMWDAERDIPRASAKGRDVPCNLMALASISSEGRLDLTVFNRSNDMVWGAYGANAVHFSVLQEYLATYVGVPVGRYWQVSNNFHAYLTTLGKAGDDWPWGWYGQMQVPDPYLAGQVTSMPMFADVTAQEIREDIGLFLEDPTRVGLRSSFLRRVACPMVMAHRAYKAGDGTAAWEILEQIIPTNDWRKAAELWFHNRVWTAEKQTVVTAHAADDGVNHDAAE